MTKFTDKTEADSKDVQSVSEKRRSPMDGSRAPGNQDVGTAPDWTSQGRLASDRYAQLFHSIDEAICIVDLIPGHNGQADDFLILEANPAMAQLAVPQSFVGQRIRDLVPDPDQQWLLTLADVARSGRPACMDYRSQSSSRWFRLSMHPIDDAAATRVAMLFIDITDRKRIEDDLIRKELLLRTVIQSASDILFIKDRHSRVVFVNEAYCQLFGIDIDTVIGKDDYDLYGEPEVAARIIENDRHVMQSGESETFEETVNTPSGPLYFQFYKSPWRDERGKIIGIVGSGMDITERKRLEFSLRRYADNLLMADSNKNHFLSMLSHELRNPLAAIVMSLDLLDHITGGSEQASRAIRVLKRQTGHLTHLVDDLLDVTRITANKIQLKMEPVELSDLVRRAISDYLPQFEDKGIELTCEFHDTPIELLADPVRLTQVVSNLVHNALKYSSRDSKVTIRLAREGDGSMAMFQVKDTGIGIEPELLPHLFEPFSQADRSLARSQGGLGLGLSIVKGMVDLHGGSVEASSEGNGKGSTFTVHLPVTLA